MQFLDEVKIYLKSGNGGHGCVSFRREKNIPMGGPDGGNGGRGGSITFLAVHGLNTLIDFRYQQHFKAKAGSGGMGVHRDGESGNDLVIKIPVGTEVIADDGHTVIYDFTEENDSFTILAGGQGGLGNAHFKSSINRAPRRTTEGKVGEEIWVWLRLKLISDAGMLGLPNAGKSSFLSKVSRARPKIANYPFTTLKPQLGVVYVDDFEFVLADIPGLIAGAHLGAGLGIKFLKHLERCGVLIHLIDVCSDQVVKDYKIIHAELHEYSELLKQKKEIVVLSKCDMVTEEEALEKQKLLTKFLKKDVLLLSSQTGAGILELLRIARIEVEKFHGKIIID